MGKKTSKSSQKKQKNRVALWIVVVFLVLVLCALILLWWGLYNTQNILPIDQSESMPSEYTVEVEDMEEISINLGYGLYITQVGRYTGPYMEDGSNEIVSNVLMIIVSNKGTDAIQYAELGLQTEAGEGFFTLSTLPAGESVALLEKNRMLWSSDETYTNALMQNVALFSAPLSLCEDRIQLQMLDGEIQVTNISEDDITGEINIYYKNSAEDLYYGGITYRARLSDGIAAGQSKQILTQHSTDSGSTIMFVTIG